MNNDYKGGSWSERFSWIITIVAMVLVAILSIGLLCALFIQPKDDIIRVPCMQTRRCI